MQANTISSSSSSLFTFLVRWVQLAKAYKHRSLHRRTTIVSLLRNWFKCNWFKSSSWRYTGSCVSWIVCSIYDYSKEITWLWWWEQSRTAQFLGFLGLFNLPVLASLTFRFSILFPLFPTLSRKQFAPTVSTAQFLGFLDLFNLSVFIPVALISYAQTVCSNCRQTFVT